MTAAGPARFAALDRLAQGYLAITGLVALGFGGRTGLAIAAAHFAGVAGLAWLRPRTPDRGLSGFLRAAYPVLLAPLFYRELATLNRLLTERFYDGMVQGWDAALFGGQPSVYLSARLPSLPLSEVLHLGYGAYYAIVPAALIGVYVTRGQEALVRTAFSVAAAFYLCYLTFIAFPVAGPRYEFERIGGHLSDGTFFRGVHAILEGGSSKGTAFPSSHIGASLSAVLAAGREDARWFWALVVPEAALALGTVYGRFHYGIDAVIGFLVALAVVGGTPTAMRWLGTGNPSPHPGYPTAETEPAERATAWRNANS